MGKLADQIRQNLEQESKEREGGSADRGAISNRVLKELGVERGAVTQKDPLGEQLNQFLKETPKKNQEFTAGTALQALEPAFIAGGSMFGGAAGAAAGPAGIAAGGALGAAGGKAAFENVIDIAHRFGVRGLPPPESLQNRIEGMTREAVLDFSFTAAAPVVSQGLRLGKRAVLKTMGVTEEGLQTARQADELGVPLGASNVTQGNVPAFFTKVLARFPILGGVARKRARETGEAVLEAKERLLFRLGPSANMADSGINLNKAATTQFKAFRRHINRKYDEAKALARQRGAVVPAKELKGNAESLLKEFADERGGLDKNNPAVKFLQEKVLKLDDAIPFNRFDGLMDQWDEAMRQAQNEGFSTKLLMKFKKDGAEPALNNLSDPEVLQKIQDADKTFARVMSEVFETPTAQRFARIEKKRFALGAARPGTRNPDEALKIAFDQESPQAMKDLKKLVGKKRFSASVGTRLRSIFDDALNAGDPEKGPVDVDRLRRSLGLNDKSSLRFQKWKQALKETDAVSMNDVEKLTNVMDAATKNIPSDVNTFIARRATLGGLRSLVSAFFPTAAAGAVGGAPGLISAGALIVTTRQINRILSSRRLVQLAERALDDTIEIQVRKGALNALVRGVAPDASNTFEAVAEAIGETPERITDAIRGGGDKRPESAPLGVTEQ